MLQFATRKALFFEKYFGVVLPSLKHENRENYQNLDPVHIFGYDLCVFSIGFEARTLFEARTVKHFIIILSKIQNFNFQLEVKKNVQFGLF